MYSNNINRRIRIMDCSDCKQKCCMAVLILIVAILSAVMGIMAPIVIMTFSSDYFVTFMITLELFILFGLAWIFVVKDKSFPQKWKLILDLGISNAFMALFILYSSDPTRTPPVMQSTLTALTVVPAVLMRYCVFGKEHVYFDKVLNVVSIILLVASVAIAGYPLASDIEHVDLMSIIWSVVYLVGICILTWYNVSQEKYVRLTETEYINTTDREKLDNKIILSFFSRIPMLIIVICAFGVEYVLVLNNETSPLLRFNESFYEAFTQLKSGLILQGFVLTYFVLFFSAIYLNAISTSYHMILTVISNPAVALFFTIFPSLNPGIQYPLWVTISSLILSISSVLFWIAGESQFFKKKCKKTKLSSCGKTENKQLREHFISHLSCGTEYKI